MQPEMLWAFGGAQPGYRPMMVTAGTSAAPLLAGFSFTLLVLVLPRLDAGAAAAESKPFSQYPVEAALLLLLAGLLLIACVQAALGLKFHGTSSSELAEWFPEHVRAPAPATEEERERLDWDAELPAMTVGDRSCAGWVRVYQRRHLKAGLFWAKITRYTYHCGILALLCGLTLLTIPPEGVARPGRWALTMVAGAGAALELLWIVLTSELVRVLAERQA